MVFWVPAIALAAGAGYFLGQGNPATSKSPETTTKHLTQAPPQPVVQTIRYETPPNVATRTQNIVVATSTALAVAIYYYYSSSRQTKIITTAVEETAGETQDLVRECDENNERRIEELDDKNQKRKNELSSEIRSESRAQFEVIGNQLELLANVSLETLRQVANGLVRGDDNELDVDNQYGGDLLDVVNEFQNQSNVNMSTEAYLQARESYLVEIQQEITKREENRNNNNSNKSNKISDKIVIHDYVTPGGPDYNTPGGPDDTNSKENCDKSYIANVTDAFFKKNTNNNSNYNDNSYSDWILSKIGGTPYNYYTKTRDFYKKHDQTILLAGIGLGSWYVFSKLSTYVFPPNKTQTQTKTIVMQA